MGTPDVSSRLNTVPGTVSILALGALAHGGRMHGFQILRWIKDRTDGDLLVEEGALYPALHRMEKQKWLKADWAISEKGRRAKYYTLTRAGRRALARESGEWNRYVAAVASVVEGAGEP